MVYSLRCRASHAATNPAGLKKPTCMQQHKSEAVLRFGEKLLSEPLLRTAYLATPPPHPHVTVVPHDNGKPYSISARVQQPGCAALPHCFPCGAALPLKTPKNRPATYPGSAQVKLPC